MVRSLQYTLGLLRLIRWQNLLIIAAVQVLAKICLIEPILGLFNMTTQLKPALMLLVVLSTVLIAAGGYAINDYFDRRIDSINKPGRMVIGKIIYPRHVMAFHMGFSITGIILGTIVAYITGQVYMSLVFIMVSGILWFYSTTYKKQLILGTFIIAFLTALVPYIILLFETPLLLDAYGAEASAVVKLLMIWILGFSLFAFLMNFARELVKDAEDFKGDHVYGKNTLAVAAGIKSVKIAVSSIIILVIVLLSIAYLKFVPDQFTLLYFIIVLILPLTGAIILVFRANSQQKFHLISMLLKYIMLAGILYMVAVNMIINRMS